MTIENKSRIQIATAPATTPISVTEFKLFARIDHDDEDAALALMISAVTDAAERYLGRALIEQSITYTVDNWPGREVELPYPPLLSVTGIYLRKSDGTWDTTAYAATNYYVITEGIPGSIALVTGATEPTNGDCDSGRFQIRYKAGYGDEATDVPAAIRQALLVWANNAYENRVVTITPPEEVRSALSLYRVERV